MNGSLLRKPAQSWGASKVIGVDIDDALIRAAWKRRKTLWSMQASESLQTHKPNAQEKGMSAAPENESSTAKRNGKKRKRAGSIKSGRLNYTLVVIAKIYFDDTNLVAAST